MSASGRLRQATADRSTTPTHCSAGCACACRRAASGPSSSRTGDRRTSPDPTRRTARRGCEVCERAGHVGKDSKAAKRNKDTAGVGGRGLPHRMRDTIKTRMREHGIEGRVSEALLAHVPPGIVGTYDHAELLPQRRDALEWWSGELARILAGDPEKGTGEPRRRAARR